MVVLLVQRGYPARIPEHALADFAVLRGSMDRAAYLERFGGYANDRGYSARANAELAAYVRAHTVARRSHLPVRDQRRRAVFRSRSAHRPSLPARQLLRRHEFPDPRSDSTPSSRDLAARRPRYLIFERLHSTSAMARAADALIYDPLVAELLSTYQQEAQVEDFTLYRRVE